MQDAPLRTRRADLPEWLDRVLKKALQPQAGRRQQALSEFLHDLHEPSAELMKRDRTPLQERHPLLLIGLRVSGY